MLQLQARLHPAYSHIPCIPQDRIVRVPDCRFYTPYYTDHRHDPKMTARRA